MAGRRKWNEIRDASLAMQPEFEQQVAARRTELLAEIGQHHLHAADAADATDPIVAAADLTLRAVRAQVEALGAELKVEAVFPSGTARRVIFSGDAGTTQHEH